jgi:hypothetical protein
MLVNVQRMCSNQLEPSTDTFMSSSISSRATKRQAVQALFFLLGKWQPSNKPFDQENTFGVSET